MQSNVMKKSVYNFLIVLSLSALVSCGRKEERTVHLDLLICETLKDNRLTEQQVQILLPFEKNSIRYLVQGNVSNSKKTISYAKEKTWWGKLGNVQKPLFSERELVSNRLKAFDLSSLSLAQPLSVDDINRISKSYDFVLGVSINQETAYSFKIFTGSTGSKDILSFIMDEILVKNPEAKILIVYNPPDSGGGSSVLPDRITLNKTELTFNKASAKEQLTATVFPPDVSEENKKVFWKSSNEAVAKVDTSGLVSAVTNGHTVISAYTGNGLSDTCSVQVKVSDTPTPAQLNDLLNKIANADDKATDQIRRILGNGLRVEGATNISNVQQLITDVSNGSRYKVTKVNTDADGKVVSISVSKQL